MWITFGRMKTGTSVYVVFEQVTNAYSKHK